MNIFRTSFFTVVFYFFVIIALSSCMKSIKSNVPELEARTKKMKTLAIVTPEIEICELSAGGVEEKRDDWCKQGRANVKKALKGILKEKGVRTKIIKKNKKNKKEIESINSLYRAVAYSIYNHTFYYGNNVNIFPERIKNFDYSIGSVKKFLKKYKADGLMIVYGSDEISSRGRKALQVVQAINPFGQMSRKGVTAMIIGVTDSTGAILWIRTFYSEGEYDLRKPESAFAYVKEVLEDYPGGKK